MKNNFEIGDLVETLDNDIIGKIVSIDGDKIKILSEDLFEIEFKANELIKLPDEELPVENHELKKVIQNELRTNTKKAESNPKPLKLLEVDLHIHELIDDARHLSNFEILNIQLNNAKKRLEWAMQKRLKSIVFIHGVGQGVLREELYALFRRYDNLEWFDANYQTYGAGATEVRIY
jgi:hypothetical protein